MASTTPRTAVARRPTVSLSMALGLLLGWPVGCATPPFDAAKMLEEWTRFMDDQYVLRPGDRLSVSVYTMPELTQDVVVPPNGDVSLRRLEVPVRAAGLPIAGFRAHVQEAYKQRLRDAEVSVLLVEAAAKSVYVAGEVKTAGAIAYTPGLTLLQAIAAAGGVELTSQPAAVIVNRKDGKGKVVAYRVDVDAVLYQADAPDFLLLPGDVVFVPTSGIADVGNWVELYIRRLIPLPLTALGV